MWCGVVGSGGVGCEGCWGTTVQATECGCAGRIGGVRTGRVSVTVIIVKMITVIFFSSGVMVGWLGASVDGARVWRG